MCLILLVIAKQTFSDFFLVLTTICIVNQVQQNLKHAIAIASISMTYPLN